MDAALETDRSGGRSKTFTWEVPVGQRGWQKASEGEGNPHVLYRLPEILEAEEVHVCEGEKAADALNEYFVERGLSPGVVATCSPTTGWEEGYTAALRAKPVTLWVDRDEDGDNQGARAFAKLRGTDVEVKAVRACVTDEKVDAFDHLAAGFVPEDAEPFTLALDGENAKAVQLAERFHDDRTSIVHVFDTDPPPRRFVAKGFMPAQESGLLVAEGGTGKGQLQFALAVPFALGMEFGPFERSAPCGVVLVSIEDDREEMHRRLTAALNARFGETPNGEGWRRDYRKALAERVRFADLRGLTGVAFDPALREHIARTCELVRDPGLVVIDPLTRLVPKGVTMNSQEGAGAILNEIDAVRDATGCMVLTSHHVSKWAIREGNQLQSGASSGSKLLEDLSRWVLNLKPLSAKDVREFGLDPGHYVQAAVVKTNYTPPLSTPLIFRRVAGGALQYVATRSKAQQDEADALTALLKAGTWLTRKKWDASHEEVSAASRDRRRDAQKMLEDSGKVVRHEIRRGRQYRILFAPSDEIRPVDWPSPPPSLDLLDGGE
jgi:RecA-family ATPase